MIAILDSVGPAVFRATLEASVLAIVVAIVIKTLDSRLRPEWRFLLWSVVLARFLIVVTPVSPWSIFNLARWERAQSMQSADQCESVPNIGEIPMQMTKQQRLSHESMDRAEPAAQMPTVVNNSAPIFNPLATPLAASEPTTRKPIWSALPWARILSCVWLVGCVAFALRLTALAISLRRRLAAARIVSDADVLELFETVRQRFGVRKLPELLVSPEPISPFLVGTLRPRIVVPESLLTESSHARLRHVLAHELAHLVRHDLWTNWLLLAARTLHWSNPIAWWTVYEMRSEREAACDELALSALGEADRTVYAATMLDLASTLSPSKIAPGMIGLFSSTSRLNGRIQRLLRAPTIKNLRGSICAALLVSIALLGLTDAMPAARANPVGDKDQAIKLKLSPTREQDSQPSANTPRDTFTIEGTTYDRPDSTQKIILPGVRLRLFKIEGMTAPPVEIAQTTSDKNGHFKFEGLAPPRPWPALRDLLTYEVYGETAERPSRSADLFKHDATGQIYDFPLHWALQHAWADRATRVNIEVCMGRKQASLRGRVIDEHGRPVARATAFSWSAEGYRAYPGEDSATTDRDGRFTIRKLSVASFGFPIRGFGIRVSQRDYPLAFGLCKKPSDGITVQLKPASCTLTGSVIDSVSGKPSEGTRACNRDRRGD